MMIKFNVFFSLLPNKKNRRLKETVKIINSLIIDMINTRMKRDVKEWENDLLSILLKEINEEGGSRLSIQDVVEDCKLFFFAGQETTAVLLVWTMVLLCRFPQWQTRAREEVFQVFGSNLPNSDGLNRLKVVSSRYSGIYNVKLKEFIHQVSMWDFVLLR